MSQAQIRDLVESGQCSRVPGGDSRGSCGGSPILPQICIWKGPTFMTRKKARVPKMVNRGWYHSNHKFWGSGSAGQGGDEFRVIRAQELLSNRVRKCSAMESWGRGSRTSISQSVSVSHLSHHPPESHPPLSS